MTTREKITELMRNQYLDVSACSDLLGVYEREFIKSFLMWAVQNGYQLSHSGYEFIRWENSSYLKYSYDAVLKEYRKGGKLVTDQMAGMIQNHDRELLNNFAEEIKEYILEHESYEYGITTYEIDKILSKYVEGENV